MPIRTLLRLALAGAIAVIPGTSAYANGDLLVAPTRVVLDGSRTTEVYLNNTGDEPATYRISLEVKRMQPEGRLQNIAEEDVNAIEQAALDMVQFSPRRITLPPNKPQTVRIGIRKPEGLPDGEYRVHMLFRAIPEARAVESDTEKTGVSINIVPIYGVTIPIIVRQGEVAASAAISGPRIVQIDGKPTLVIDVARTGDASLYGDLLVMKAGQEEPVFQARGIGIYPEIGSRRLSFTIDDETAAKLRGPVTVRFVADRDEGSSPLAEYSGELR